MGAYRLIPFRRVLDLLVIVALAGGLLWLAGQVAGERQTPQSPVADSLPSDPANAELPELQLLLPLERIGMVLSQETILGDPQSAMDHLDQKCREPSSPPDAIVPSGAMATVWMTMPRGASKCPTALQIT